MTLRFPQQGVGQGSCDFQKGGCCGAFVQLQTGKTEAAEAVCHVAGLDLEIVDAWDSDYCSRDGGGWDTGST